MCSGSVCDGGIVELDSPLPLAPSSPPWRQPGLCVKHALPEGSVLGREHTCLCVHCSCSNSSSVTRCPVPCVLFSLKVFQAVQVCV